MKKILYLIYGAFLVMNTGCGNDPFSLKKGSVVKELSIDGEEKVIKIEGGGNDSGIGIEFCLVNEQGIPATIFREGENFRFRLTIINNYQKDTAMYIDSDFIGNPELFQVYRENGIIVGKPWDICGCYYISDQINKIRNGKKWILTTPWHVQRTCDDKKNKIKFLQCRFKGLNQKPLSKGSYYTTLVQKFCLGRYFDYRKYLEQDEPPEELICTEVLKLKINFEIR